MSVGSAAVAHCPSRKSSVMQAPLVAAVEMDGGGGATSDRRADREAAADVLAAAARARVESGLSGEQVARALHVSGSCQWPDCDAVCSSRDAWNRSAPPLRSATPSPVAFNL